MSTMSTTELTPLMRQYHDIKIQYSDALLLFQVGDFYELFFDDAKRASQFLGIALTKRGKVQGEPIPLCGIPVHALDHYLTKLIKGGFKVAICDQLEEPKPGKVVDRGVTQVLTPGTLTDTKWLSEKSASYLFSFFPGNDSWGLLFGELLTAQLFGTVIPVQAFKSLESELIRFFPDEVIIPGTKSAQPFALYFKQRGYYTTALNESVDDQELQTKSWINIQFPLPVREQLTTHTTLQLALSNFYTYMRATQYAAVEQFKSLHVYKPDDFLLLDAATVRNLELVKNITDGSSKNTLFEVLDNAATSMGSRMLKKWLVRPLVKQVAIEQRLDAVELLVEKQTTLQELQTLLHHMGDIERVVGRIALGRASHADYLNLKDALEKVPALIILLSAHTTSYLFEQLLGMIADFSSLFTLLDSALNDDQTQQWIIKKGFDAQLDHIRELVLSGHQKILALEHQEQIKTGISSLKIRFNNIYGYYVEITKANADLVPAHYQRQQTLVGRERYMMPELHSLQTEIARAKSDIEMVQRAVFDQIKQQVFGHLSNLRKLAHGMAYLDALAGLAYTAYQYHYVRPIFNERRDIMITNGRHPVVERAMPHTFIPNDTLLTDAEATWIITGPNMGGKSTYLRQVALISIMGQVGSFVPAQKADLPLIDRIFTRIGAGDNVAEGKSTFLVEMEETATICTYATSESLVILDEVGRGTSTFDGLAIAQAVVEYIHTVLRSRCLFATHYHELSALKEQFTGIASYYAASKKTEQGIVFLYRILKGIADGSFGIEVAKLAQLPSVIIDRSREILNTISLHEHTTVVPAKALVNATTVQANSAQSDAVLALVQSIDFDALSPRQAFDIVWQLRQMAITSKQDN